MKEKISIIIPTYNIEQYVGACLDSVINQTWENLEIIVVDDGSTDDTVKILEIYAKKDVRIKVIKKENGGVTSARLVGVQQATGEFIGFVDGDDIIESDMYERLLKNAKDYHADISHCGYQMVLQKRIDFYYNTGRVVQQDQQDGLRDLLEGLFIEPGLCNKLFHKRLFHNLLDEAYMDLSIKNNEDLLMNFYLFREANRSVFEDWCPYHYLVRKGSATSSTTNIHRLLDPLRVTKILIKETEGNTELQSVLLQKYIRQLINIGTMPIEENSELIRPNKIKARILLKNSLRECLKNEKVSKKVKVMALWVTICPWSYEKVYWVYDKITGINKKYSLD